MVFDKKEGKKGDKVKPVGPGDVIEPEKKHGPTVQHKAHAGPHFSHEEKQHIKFLRNKIRDHKPLTEDDVEYAKEHKMDLSHAVIGKGKSAHAHSHAKKPHKVNYDNITFDWRLIRVIESVESKRIRREALFENILFDEVNAYSW